MEHRGWEGPGGGWGSPLTGKDKTDLSSNPDFAPFQLCKLKQI